MNASVFTGIKTDMDRLMAEYKPGQHVKDPVQDKSWYAFDNILLMHFDVLEDDVKKSKVADSHVLPSLKPFVDSYSRGKLSLEEMLEIIAQTRSCSREYLIKRGFDPSPVEMQMGIAANNSTGASEALYKKLGGD
jgi:hypothetical protein